MFNAPPSASLSTMRRKKDANKTPRRLQPRRCVITPSGSLPRKCDNAQLKDYLVASAFAGIGGMDRGFQLAGFDVVVQIENDKWCLEVLRKQFGSGIERYTPGNIRDVKLLPAGVKVLLVTPPCVDLSSMNIFGVGIHGKETGKIREVFRILKAMKEKNQFVPIVVIENVLNILSAEAMKYLIEAFSELEYDYLAWRTVDLLGALPHSRNRVILVATRDGINPHDILFEANPECECEKVRTGEEKIGNEYSSSSAVCALCQNSPDAPTIQEVAVIVNTSQINQAPSYHKNPCLLTSNPSTYVCEFRRKNSKKRKFEDIREDNGNNDDADDDEEENPFPCYKLDIRDIERLMGFPEDYTKISSASENDCNRRVKLLANVIAVNHSEWIAQSCSNAIRNKVAIDDEEEKNGCTPSFLSTRKIIEEKFTVLRRKNGETIRISSLYDKDKNFPECGLIDLKSNSDAILIPKGDIHRYPVLNTYVPLPIFLKYKNTQIGDKNKRVRLFKYAERLLQHWAALEYWILVALVRDDAQRRGLLQRFGDKVVLNDDNIDILEVADFEESVASFCEKKGDVKFISGNEKYADFLDVDALANKIRKRSIASDALRGGKLVLVDGNVAEKNKGNDLCARWPAVALTFPEDAETIKATMKKFGRFGETFSSIVSTREVFVCYFNRNNRRCEWVHENKVSDIFSEVIEDELETKKRRRETFGEDEERKKAFEGANLCRREMEKIIKNGKNTRDDADDAEDDDNNNNNNNNNKNKNDTLCNSMKGDGAVGMRVDVFWPKEKKYYRGIVNSFDADSQRHHVIYDDGDEEKALNFEKEKILLPLWGISKKIKLDRRGGYKRAHPD